MENPMELERRSQPFCNIYTLHCQGEFAELKSDIKDIKKALMGNGDIKNSLVSQSLLNTNHRLWMEGWGRMILASFTIALFGFVGTLIWMVSNGHARP